MRKVGQVTTLAFITVLCVSSIIYLDIRPSLLAGGFTNLGELWGDAFPPQLEVIPTALRALLETLAIALLGTVFGFLFAFPFGVAGAKNLSPGWAFVASRTICSGIRTLPSLLWAVMFVILVGFHALAGVLAMTMYTMGHLAKLQYESFEGLAPEPIDAIRAIGANRMQVIRFVVLPEASNQLVSQVLYMLEYNVRASSIVGFVGAGGIGFYISRFLQALQYDGVITLLGVVFVAVVAIDLVSQKIRARFTDRPFAS